MFNGLKPVAIIYAEPMALKSFEHSKFQTHRYIYEKAPLLILRFPKLNDIAFGVQYMHKFAIVILCYFINNGHVVLF
jgi:urate oxidase